MALPFRVGGVEFSWWNLGKAELISWYCFVIPKCVVSYFYPQDHIGKDQKALTVKGKAHLPSFPPHG